MTVSGATKDAGQLETLMGMQSSSLSQKSLAIRKLDLPSNPVRTFLNIDLREMKTYSHKKLDVNIDNNPINNDSNWI